MLGWSFKLFRILGIQLSVHFTFPLLLAYAAWEGWTRGAAQGLAWNISFVLLMFTCVVMHELGHSLAARRYGVIVPRILLLPIGGMAEFDRIPRKSSEEIIIAICGPLVNLLIIASMYPFVNFPDDWGTADFPFTLGELARHILIANAIMGVFNLAPVFPMDGGRIFRALLAIRFTYLRATFIAATIGKVLAGSTAIYLSVFQGLHLTAVLFAFIFFAGEMEYRFVKRREEESALWAERIRRAYIEPAPVADEEPPLLP